MVKYNTNVLAFYKNKQLTPLNFGFPINDYNLFNFQEIRVPNCFVRAKQYLSINEKRILNYCLSLISKQDRVVSEEYLSEYLSNRKFVVDANFFADVFGYKNTKNVYRDLKLAVEKLQSKHVHLEMDFPEGEFDLTGIKLTKSITQEILATNSLKLPIFKTYNYIDSEGRIELTFHEKIYPFLFSFTENYTKYNLKLGNIFKSCYAQRMFELLQTRKDTNSIYINLKDLRYILNIPSSYKTYSKLKERVFNPIVKEFQKLGLDIYIASNKKQGHLRSEMDSDLITISVNKNSDVLVEELNLQLDVHFDFVAFKRKEAYELCQNNNLDENSEDFVKEINRILKEKDKYRINSLYSLDHSDELRYLIRGKKPPLKYDLSNFQAHLEKTKQREKIIENPDVIPFSCEDVNVAFYALSDEKDCENNFDNLENSENQNDLLLSKEIYESFGCPDIDEYIYKRENELKNNSFVGIDKNNLLKNSSDKTTLKDREFKYSKTKINVEALNHVAFNKLLKQYGELANLDLLTQDNVVNLLKTYPYLDIEDLFELDRSYIIKCLSGVNDEDISSQLIFEYFFYRLPNPHLYFLEQYKIEYLSTLNENEKRNRQIALKGKSRLKEDLDTKVRKMYSIERGMLKTIKPNPLKTTNKNNSSKPLKTTNKNNSSKTLSKKVNKNLEFYKKSNLDLQDKENQLVKQKLIEEEKNNANQEATTSVDNKKPLYKKTNETKENKQESFLKMIQGF